VPDHGVEVLVEHRPQARTIARRLRGCRGGLTESAEEKEDTRDERQSGHCSSLMIRIMHEEPAPIVGARAWPSRENGESRA
jgi:hypothetical protein